MRARTIAIENSGEQNLRRRRDQQRPFLRSVNALVADLRRPEPRIYWLDLFATLLVGYGASALYLASALGSTQQIGLGVCAGFALFRAGSFMHEIQHLPRGVMTRFKLGWNVLCGIPMLTPSFMYENHASHHHHATYGTRNDGEYLPLGNGTPALLAIYALQAILLPGFVAIRFLFLVPPSLVNQRVRRLVLERCSHFGINPAYRQPLPHGGEPAWWRWIDAACSIRIWTPVALAMAGIVGWSHLALLYLLGVFSLGLNYVRNLSAHRYVNQGEQMTYAEQFADSITITGVPVFTELWFPVGLRYHALHHLCPTLPYHNLPKAHRRLMEQLPASSPYRASVHDGYLRIAARLIGNALRSPTNRRLQPESSP